MKHDIAIIIMLLFATVLTIFAASQGLLDPTRMVVGI
jgi:hypothetical protein